MPAFDEFRLVVQPAMTAGGEWTVRIDESNIKAQIGRSATLQPTMLREQLEALRKAGFNDLVKLKGIGTAVWSSVLSDTLGPSLEASTQVATDPGRRLRVVLLRLGIHADPPPGKIAGSGLP